MGRHLSDGIGRSDAWLCIQPAHLAEKGARLQRGELDATRDDAHGALQHGIECVTWLPLFQDLRPLVELPHTSANELCTVPEATALHGRSAGRSERSPKADMTW